VSFQVDVVSPEAVVWSGEADFVAARTTEGDMGILADHEPTMAVLATGTAVIHQGSERTTIAVHGGFLQIFRNQVTLLSDRAEIAEGDDAAVRARAEELRAEAEEVEGETTETAGPEEPGTT
jgi:F-type H+-transporting ATPase subunit epsilon